MKYENEARLYKNIPLIVLVKDKFVKIIFLAGLKRKDSKKIIISNQNIVQQ
jgi:hypothetical protein